MSFISLLGLSIALFIFALSPGPGVFATVARSMASGFRPAVAVVAGIILGDLIYLMFAIFGLTFVAQTMGKLFIFMKICGGLYLVWLGLRIWLLTPEIPRLGQATDKRSQTENFLSGLLTTLSNPKVVLFYCGFLPAFLDIRALTLPDIVLIGCMVVIVLAVVLHLYAYLASRARQFFSNTIAVRRMNKVAGGLMMAAGVTIATRP